MSNADEWVTHNLQRQRKILEEKQRQRRLQTTGVFSVNGVGNTYYQSPYGQQHHQPSRDGIMRPSSSSTNLSGLYSTSTGQNSATNSHTSASTSLYSTNSYTTDNRQNGHRPRSNTMSSSANLNFGYESSGSAASSNGAPKVITVKGITPPQARKQFHNTPSTDDIHDSAMMTRADVRPKTAARTSTSYTTDSWNHSPSPLPPHTTQHTINTPVPNKPVVNVSRLEALGIIEDKSLLNTEREEETSIGSNTRLINGHPTGGMASNHHHPWEDDDDEDPIPTDVLDQELPMEVADIVNNLDQFVVEPTKKNVTLKCKITRGRKGVDKGIFPIYYCHLEKSDGRRVFLLAARRRKKSATANYLISTDPTDLSRNARSYVAKVRSNALGTAFTIYGNGENPKKASVIGDSIRQELAAVIYETNILGLKGPRKMTIIIPGIYNDEKHNIVRPVIVRPISERDSILERHKQHRLDEMVVLNNKQPVWNEDTQSYVLNFHGRVTQASVKNFQIVHCLEAPATANKQLQSSAHPGIPITPEPAEYIVMQFGRIDNESFTMDVRYPLSPVQAFGIAMTSFHGKLACE
ncbi:tub family domain-containing protein [Ditylenchus destructor]|uniref:Tubby-like protein n=1 Tax=Ditylenchus destructor TaxID=166010 RepID=A0AAD4MQM3_9BILA|nr:tub family domain-containing protein [Ditylenchus destructor]